MKYEIIEIIANILVMVFVLTAIAAPFILFGYLIGYLFGG